VTSLRIWTFEKLSVSHRNVNSVELLYSIVTPHVRHFKVYVLFYFDWNKKLILQNYFIVLSLLMFDTLKCMFCSTSTGARS
jgi:hypothetical protein